MIDIPTIDPSIDLGELYKKLVYPRKAKVNEIQGSVVVSVLISSDGRILKHRIEGNPHTYLVDAAIAAVYSCKISPAEFQGEKVTSWLTIPIKFQLR